MKTSTQTYLAKKANISDAFLSEILAGKKSPSWETAKKLSKFSHIPVSIWMESKNSYQEIRERLNRKWQLKK
jgi:transcriptional regulator with XRE-family HTH domain